MENRIFILPTAYFPPIEYFFYLFNYPNFEIEIHDSYKKQTIRNHCLISNSDGKMRLTIPVNMQFGNNTPTKDIKIDYSTNWIRQHLLSIKTAYNKSPYFEYFEADISNCLNKKYNYLIELNYEIISLFISWFRLKVKLNYTSDYRNPNKIQYQKTENKILFWDDRQKTENQKKYNQMFDEKNGFIPDLSILDLFFNCGLDSYFYIKNFDK